MTWWQTLVVAVVPAIIAPVFLALQQRRQLSHDRQVRADDTKARDDDAREVRGYGETARRRDAYGEVIRAVSRYRVALARGAYDEQRTSGIGVLTRAVTEPAPETPFTSKRHIEALEAVSVARLYATDDVMPRLLALDAALTDSEMLGMTPTRGTHEVARSWVALEGALEQFVRAAQDDV